ncbi:putative membrane protein YeaQ/YmgE (transglycosylase-associated protein family) [Caballeronia udeis]|uniref:Membrane protein YeaQ/YmgE (Transglycosylase-associated protein family) n=1 Tax=Caballeronia udeis TaxID=1232866 RepID=A0ABW8MWN9_9BURK
MGWPGIVFLGLVVGLAAGWLHPLRRSVSRPFGRIWAAGLAGVVAAMVAKMLGNITGAFHDGDSLEWLVCVLFALVAVTVTVGLAARR